MRFKKSQVTLFAIIGVVLVLVIGFVFYLKTSSVKRQIDPGKTVAPKVKIQLQPIEDYVVQCLNKVTKEGLVLLGKQGGYLYRSQGGSQIDFRDVFEGEVFVNYPAGGYKVAYGIHPLRQNVGKYSFSAPEYPWAEFPSDGAGGETFEGVFGVSELQDITKLEQHLETYIENNMKECIDWSVLKDYEVDGGNIEANLEIAKKDISVNLIYPLTIKQKSTGDATAMEEFFTRQEGRLREIYDSVRYLIDRDIKNVNFDIEHDAVLKDGLSIEVVREVYEQDDIIIVKDGESLIDDKPYEFVFARSNRMPALYYISMAAVHLPAGHTITADDLVVGGMTGLKANDPDEDTYTFSIEPAVPRILNLPNIDFKIKVNDGEFEDYQTVTVART